MTLKKNQMAPVYLVLGEEQVNAEKIKQKLIANFPEEEREFNIGIYDMEGGNAINCASRCNVSTVFGKSDSCL